MLHLILAFTHKLLKSAHLAFPFYPHAHTSALVHTHLLAPPLSVSLCFNIILDNISLSPAQQQLSAREEEGKAEIVH